MAARTDQEWSAALIRRTAQIAKALGLTRGQVLGKMHRLGLKTKNPPRKWLNTALVEKLTELTDQRLSASQIGQALGLTAPPGHLQDAAPRPQNESKDRVAGRAGREDTRTNQPRTVSWRNCQGTWANARPGPRQNASTRPEDEERSQPEKPAPENGAP